MNNRKNLDKISNGGKSQNVRFKLPNKKYLNILQSQASQMAELLGKNAGIQFIEEALIQFPDLSKIQIDNFMLRK